MQLQRTGIHKSEDIGHENSIVVKIPFNWINNMGDKVGNKMGDNSHKTGFWEILNAGGIEK